MTEQQHGDDPTFVRIGGHWGSPRRRGDDFVGKVVNLAARIVDLAGAGEVLVSEALLDAAGDLSPLHAHAHELGPVFVKGVPDPVALYRVEAVVKRRAARRRFGRASSAVRYQGLERGRIGSAGLALDRFGGRRPRRRGRGSGP